METTPTLPKPQDETQEPSAAAAATAEEAEMEEAGFEPMCAPCVTVDTSQLSEQRDEAYVPPIERIITPRDVTDIQDSDETIYIIGTKDNKVTCIRGLERNRQLKVSLVSLPAFWRCSVLTVACAVMLGAHAARLPDLEAGRPREPRKLAEARAL